MSEFIKDNLVGAIDKAGGDMLLQSMMVVTAIEFCGSVLTGKTGPNNTRRNFIKFWESKYMPRKYHGKGELLYKIFRNGVSHSFMAKGGVIPSGHKDGPDLDLRFYLNGIFVYVPELAKNVKDGIFALLADLSKNKFLRENYYSVFKSLRDVGQSEYDKFTKENKIEVEQKAIGGDINLDTFSSHENNPR